MTEWNYFYVAVAGASLSLTGLIFVGVSISLTKILSIKGLADRTLLSLVLLLNILVLSILFLAPNQASRAFSTEVLTARWFVWKIVFRLDLRILKHKQKQYKKQHPLNMLID